MNEIETYKTINFKKIIPINTDNFNLDIFVHFKPDEMVLKNVSFYSGTAYLESFVLTSDLYNNETLFSMPRTGTFFESYNTMFKLNNNVNGTYNFKIMNYNNQLIQKATISEISFTLTFIKWKVNEKKPITIIRTDVSDEEDKQCEY